jgi:hypothetical protein
VARRVEQSEHPAARDHVAAGLPYATSSSGGHTQSANTGSAQAT